MEGDREKMRPIKERRRSSSSPARERPSRSRSPTLLPPSASLLDAPLISQDEDDANRFESLNISQNSNPRSFPYSVKQQCWEKAEKIKGRDPDRWRRDAVGNTVFRKLVGCPGCLCHDYDHIIPYSKGGQSTLENCQVLQAAFGASLYAQRYTMKTPVKERIPALVSAKVNRSKGNRTEVSKSDLIQKSSYCRVSGRDMDLLELSAYGNVRRGQDSGGCAIQ